MLRVKNPDIWVFPTYFEVDRPIDLPTSKPTDQPTDRQAQKGNFTSNKRAVWFKISFHTNTNSYSPGTAPPAPLQSSDAAATNFAWVKGEESVNYWGQAEIDILKDR